MNKIYTMKDYEEGLCIICFVKNKYFPKAYFDDYEQVVNDCLFELFKKNSMFDSSRGCYSTFAVRVIKNFFTFVLNRNSRARKVSKSELLHFDDLVNGENTLSDYIGTEDNYDEIGVYDVIERVLKHYKEKECQIIRLYIRGYKMPEIAKAFLCTKQNVFKIINKFRKDLRVELKKVGYEI